MYTCTHQGEKRKHRHWYREDKKPEMTVLARTSIYCPIERFRTIYDHTKNFTRKERGNLCTVEWNMLNPERFIKKTSVVLSPRANYTDWATATCWQNLVATFVDRGVSRGQRDGSLTVVNLSFLYRSRYFSFK
jgi:hypothetical protein